MDFAGGIWAFWDILVPSTALSMQEFRSSNESEEFKERSQKPGSAGAGDALGETSFFQVISNQ
jgi:hypothetical protein